MPGTTTPSASKAQKKPQTLIGTIATPYGQLSINASSAADHASMVSAQLSSLLLLMMADDAESFRACNDGAQVSLLWLARNMADELTAVIPLVVADAQTRGAA